MSGGWLRVVVMAVFLTLCINTDASAQALRRGRAQQVTGGILIERLDSLEQARADSIANVPDELKRLSEKRAKQIADSLARVARRKARHAKASVLLREGKQAEALEVFKTLSSEVKSAEGAEARYRLIEAEYAAKRYDKAEEMVYAFSDSKTPQNYWLAKSFILLGDIYMSRGDAFQARATYQRVVDGYSPADDGIVAEAKEKIAKME